MVQRNRDYHPNGTCPPEGGLDSPEGLPLLLSVGQGVDFVGYVFCRPAQTAVNIVLAEKVPLAVHLLYEVKD